MNTRKNSISSFTEKIIVQSFAAFVIAVIFWRVFPLLGIVYGMQVKWVEILYPYLKIGSTGIIFLLVFFWNRWKWTLSNFGMILAIVLGIFFGFVFGIHFQLVSGTSLGAIFGICWGFILGMILGPILKRFYLFFKK